MAFLLVTAVLALFSSHAFGANFTRDDKILRDSATYYTDLTMQTYATATQSSTVAHDCRPTASRAKDGNSEGVFHPWCSVSHTNNDPQAWWEVDVGEKSLVHSVIIFNRIDCCMERLSNFDVILKDESHKVLKSLHEAEGGKEMMTFLMDPILKDVRYVRVQLRETNYLSLAEVDVYGTSNSAKKRNVARNQAATQSSTVAHECSPTASKAVDGNTEGVFHPWCSVTHTNNDPQAWWQVDLGGLYHVYWVSVFNRVDCCMERLANFNVTLKGANGETKATRHFDGGTNTEVYSVNEIAYNVRYVRVQLLGQGILSLAEVQVISY